MNSSVLHERQKEGEVILPNSPTAHVPPPPVVVVVIRASMDEGREGNRVKTNGIGGIGGEEFAAGTASGIESRYRTDDPWAASPKFPPNQKISRLRCCWQEEETCANDELESTWRGSLRPSTIPPTGRHRPFPIIHPSPLFSTPTLFHLSLKKTYFFPT